MRICFLIGDYVPHQVLTIRTIQELYNLEIKAYHVARFNKYIPSDIKNFETRLYSDFSKIAIKNQILEFNPNLIVISGWMIPEYVWIAKKLKRRLNIPIVSYSDTQWHGTFRQRINALISAFHVRKAFTHIWVAGIYQFEYARKLGFKKENILYNSLCADIELFHKVSIKRKEIDYPKNILYIGRFIPLKGLNILVKAWSQIQNKNGWTLTLIGDGPLKNKFVNSESIIVKDFMVQENLIEELQHAGCFVLPSLKEPWALVIQEAAAAGLPIICTEACGAAPHFVIDKHNGFKIKTGSKIDLQNALEYIVNSDVRTLIKMSENSRKLSYSITPNILVDSLMQLI